MKVRISSPQFLAGDYPIDFDFDHGEAHLIKKVSGLRGLEIDDGLVTGDTDLYLAFAVIGLLRAGRPESETTDLIAELMKQKLGAFRLIEDEDDAEEEVDPKASTPGGSDKTSSSSGATTPTPSDDSPETTPDGTGDPT